LSNFLRPLHPTSGEWIAAVAKRFGLCFADPVPVASSGTVRVRWRDSAVFDDIFRWASA